MIVVTLDQVREAAKPYIESQRRNPKVPSGQTLVCEYTTATGQHCVVGQILTDLGLPLPGPHEVITVTRWRVRSVNRSGIKDLTEWLSGRSVEFEHAAENYLFEAQKHADRGRTWEFALSEAEECATTVAAQQDEE